MIMKKIMFNDKFGLTKAVLEGRKTMTRRVCKDQQWSKSDLLAFNYDRLTLMTPPNYLIGEVVAIAQSYNDVIEEWKKGYGQGFCFSPKDRAGMTNKMFVRADDMPHHIKITNILVEHLQDISDEDCLREGIRKWDKVGNPLGPSYDFVNSPHGYTTPREAFAALIDKVSGKGTWESDPMVWVYEFELVD